MKCFSFVLLILLAFSCHNPNTDKLTEVEETNPEFQKFLSRFQLFDMPFEYSSNRNLSSDMKFPKVNLKSSDSLYVKAESSDEIYCFGRLKDTTNFYTLIYLFTASDYYPVAATYTKAGKLISQEPLIVNGCGGDCGMTNCSSTGRINKDFSIFCSDTITYEFHCDDKGEPILNSGEVSSDQIYGRIDKKGKIILEPQKHIVVSKSKANLAAK